MIKNRDAQIVFQSMYCAIGIIGIIASTGFFEYNFGSDFIIYFTNLSNYFCIGVMFAALVQTLKKKEDSYVTINPLVKFTGVMSILLVGLVYNIMLAPTYEPIENFQPNSVILHIILPIMFVADWFLFYERKQLKWFYPLITTISPLGYIAFIYIRAAILGYDTQNHFIYPYFFLNLDTEGITGAIKWTILLTVAFVIVAYLLFGVDRITGGKKRNKQDI